MIFLPKKKKKEICKVNTYVVIAIIALIVVVILLSILPKSKQKVVASVNGEEITEQELDFIIKFVPPPQREAISKQALIDDAIAIKLINQEAAKKGINVKDEEVDASIKNMLKQFNSTEKDFNNMLQQQGLTPEDFKSMQKQQLITSKLINQTIMQNVSVTYKELMDFYEQYKMQINATFEEVKDELKNALILQKANSAFFLYLQQLRAAADIKIY